MKKQFIHNVRAELHLLLIGFFSYCNKYRQHLVPFFWRECNWKGLLRAGCSEELRLTPLISECFWSLRHTSAVLVEQLQQNKNLKEELKVSVLFAVWEFSPWTGLLQISAAIHAFLFIFFIFLPLEEIDSGATWQKRCQSPPHQRAAAADLPPVVPRAAEISVFFPWTLSTRVSDSAVNLAPHQIEPPRRLIWQGSANYTPSVAMMSWWKAPVPKSSKPHYSPHSPRLRKISFSARALGVLHTHPCAHPICARSELAFCARSPRVYLCARALIEFEIQLLKEEKGYLWSNVTQEQKKNKDQLSDRNNN